MILGIDVSTYFEEMASNAKYYENDRLVEPLELFYQNGVEYMRIRVWNNPYDENNVPYLGGTCDVDNFIKLSKLAISKGYKILLDFHYSDFWADPGKQILPKEWSNLTIDELENKIYEFTVDVLKRAKDAGVNVELVQIGNEITNGMCWPIGRLIEDSNKDTRSNYHSLVRLLKKGIKGAKEVFPNIKIVLHLEKSYDQKIYYEFFNKMREYNVEYDIIGASYYPYWHGTFEAFFNNMNMCQKEFNKDIMVMELGYGFTLEDYIKTNNGTAHLVVNDSNLDSFNFNKPYPLTKEGQRDFIKEFLRLAKINNIKGVFYWEPLWIPGENICWASKEGQKYIKEEGKTTRNEWANQCLFDYEGKATPAFYEFKKED